MVALNKSIEVAKKRQVGRDEVLWVPRRPRVPMQDISLGKTGARASYSLLDQIGSAGHDREILDAPGTAHTLTEAQT